ncbi:MAG: hypothetical protein ACYCU0_14680, partial [Solirubrobacteraceae bacterium]
QGTESPCEGSSRRPVRHPLPAVPAGALPVAGPPTLDRGPPALDRRPPTLDRGPPAPDRRPPALDRGPPALDEALRDAKSRAGWTPGQDSDI